MVKYRIYFLNSDGRFEAREDFGAGSDEEAVTMAELVFDAVTEGFTGYELWQANHMISNRREAGVPQNLCAIAAYRQAQVANMEERLRDSRVALFESRRLLDKLNDFRRNMQALEPG